MKRLVVLTAISALLVLGANCGSGDDGRRDATSTGKFGWIFEGWACAPDAAKALKGLSPANYCQDSDEKDHLYMKFTARASQRAVAAKSIAMMKSTCRRAAKDQASAEIYEKIKGAIIESASGVVDGESTGQAIITQLQGKVRGIGIYDCCPLNPETGACDDIENIKRGEAWKECDCVAVGRLPGGKEAIEAAAEEIETQQ
ncbi:MAG: lipoprotein LipL21 [Leptospiraceae bacterium]|nr:lipoprotein LipL21 [Leptospiraceae bacterium]